MPSKSPKTRKSPKPRRASRSPKKSSKSPKRRSPKRRSPKKSKSPKRRSPSRVSLLDIFEPLEKARKAARASQERRVEQTVRALKSPKPTRKYGSLSLDDIVTSALDDYYSTAPAAASTAAASTAASASTGASARAAAASGSAAADPKAKVESFMKLTDYLFGAGSDESAKALREAGWDDKIGALQDGDYSDKLYTIYAKSVKQIAKKFQGTFCINMPYWKEDGASGDVSVKNLCDSVPKFTQFKAAAFKQYLNGGGPTFSPMVQAAISKINVAAVQSAKLSAEDQMTLILHLVAKDTIKTWEKEKTDARWFGMTTFKPEDINQFKTILYAMFMNLDPLTKEETKALAQAVAAKKSKIPTYAAYALGAIAVGALVYWKQDAIAEFLPVIGEKLTSALETLGSLAQQAGTAASTAASSAWEWLKESALGKAAIPIAAKAAQALLPAPAGAESIPLGLPSPADSGNA
jgi:hypothetical protein